jgi:hypothetical protein
VARAKNTARAEARRRHRDQQRVPAVEPNTLSMDATAAAPAAAPAQQRRGFAMPDVRADIAALPGMFRTRKLLWVPFGMLLAGFVIDLLLRSGSLTDEFVAGLAVTYWQLIMHPTGLFVFFIGGFLAPRASWLVGGILGVVDAALLTAAVFIAVSAGWTSATMDAAVATEDAVALWVMAIVLGVLAAAFASWYRNFLRASQERARANRLARDRERAEKAKEQARQDKAAARELNRRAP